MPANAAERKLLHRMLLLGLALTACAAGLQAIGILAPLEGFLFDQRVKRCQYTAPPPTDKVVHFDIDESTLQTVGAWPWPRVIMADVVRELHRAGAQVIALDVLYNEEQNKQALPEDRDNAIEQDAPFAKALADSGNAILPVDFGFKPLQVSANHFSAVMLEMGGNLEITPGELNRKLAARNAAPATQDEFDLALQRTAAQRLLPMFNAGKTNFADVSHELLPNYNQDFLGGSLPTRRLRQEYAKFSAWEGTRHLFPYAPATSVTLLEPFDEKLPLAMFGKSIATCGFVTELIGETTVRSLPLLTSYQGQMIPQFGFSAALLYLGTKPGEVKVSDDALVIPDHRPGGRDIVIPVHDELVPGYGPRGTFIDIPLFGTSDWETMYDYPRHAEIRQHYRLSSVTVLRDARRHVRHNNEQADKAFHDLFNVGSDEIQKYESKKRDFDSPTALSEEITANAEVCQQLIDAFGPLKPEEFAKLPESEQKQFDAAKVLMAVAKQNADFVKLLAPAEAELRGWVEGRVVFIGSTASGTDLRTTSLHARCPGVVIHGAIVNAILTNYFWRRLPTWMTYLCIFGVGAAATVTASYLRPTGAFLFTMAIGVGFAAFNAIVVFGHWRDVLGMAGPLSAVFLVWTVIPIVRFLSESSMRWRIQRRFSTYVDPALVNYLTEHPEKMRLAGELKEITVVFTDLAGFTSLTEKMRERAVEILSEYMALVIPLIRSHRGYVSKFIGDGLMFFYGAPLENPNQAADAVDTAVEMLNAVDGFASALAKRGLDRLGLRIGINTATMVVGDTGIDTAADYTPLGDGMNLGSRLEGANKMFGTRILISARTVYQLNGRYLVRKIANLIVKGKTEAVMAYEPLVRSEDATAEQKSLAEMSDAMVDAYIASEFETCLELCRQIDAAFGKNRLTACYRERSNTCIQTPPQIFNGTIQMSEK